MKGGVLGSYHFMGSQHHMGTPNLHFSTTTEYGTKEAQRSSTMLLDFGLKADILRLTGTQI